MNTKEFTLSLQHHVDAELGRVRFWKIAESIKLLQLIIGKLSNAQVNTKLGKVFNNQIFSDFQITISVLNFSICCVL